MAVEYTPAAFILMRLSKKLPLIALAILCAISPNLIADVKVGDAMPDLTAYKLEGDLPKATKDKVVLLDFWASWCGPCEESFPAMVDLLKKYGSQGLVIVAVNVDEKKADMDGFLKSHAATFIVVRDAKQKLVEKTGISTMPSSFLIGKDGKVAYSHSGFHGSKTVKQYEHEIETLLSAK